MEQAALAATITLFGLSCAGLSWVALRRLRRRMRDGDDSSASATTAATAEQLELRLSQRPRVSFSDFSIEYVGRPSLSLSNNLQKSSNSNSADTSAFVELYKSPWDADLSGSPDDVRSLIAGLNRDISKYSVGASRGGSANGSYSRSLLRTITPSSPPILANGHGRSLSDPHAISLQLSIDTMRDSFLNPSYPSSPRTFPETGHNLVSASTFSSSTLNSANTPQFPSLNPPISIKKPIPIPAAAVAAATSAVIGGSLLKRDPSPYLKSKPSSDTAMLIPSHILRQAEEDEEDFSSESSEYMDWQEKARISQTAGQTSMISHSSDESLGRYLF
ncbi:hypothetical protein BCR33DRAFT_732709 [Rhizoclosmatium globosum]|uniref:Uncharacterized protein n=1 Tax=Rhizoclosmatium globosum TaxID=329046 RepID=A0A1Y2D0Q2_9FUNG|nr:hypothetical protein BCR33DRAFT_732709 [Rhizoclosmatium globosum]|eukprot:ORY52858.1 hypothetical protein BCR33DRAFT_732709 [Rhizoclosmatium globosum]